MSEEVKQIAQNVLQTTFAKPTCEGKCLPYYIYIGIAAISIIGSLFFGQGGIGTRLGRALMGALWSAFWAFVIYQLCARCEQGWAWFLLLLPTILMGLSVLFLTLAKAISPRR